MGKNVLILSASPRKGGNSDILCDEFKKGAEKSGNSVEKIFLRDKKISPCVACYYCKDHEGKCAINDDMAYIIDRIMKSDVIVMASPVYFYSVNAQIKALIDRCVAKWLDIKNKEFYYIMTAAEDSQRSMDCALECFRGFAKCLEGSVEKGVIFGTGVYTMGEIKSTAFMKEAYEMGLNV